MTSGHGKRLLTSAVALPLLALVILKGGRIGFALLVGLAAAVGLLEYHALFLPRETPGAKATGLILGLAVIGSFCTKDIGATAGMLVAAFLGSAVVCLVRFKPGDAMAVVLYRQVMGFVYVPFLLGHLILVRDWNRGIIWAFFLLAVVFAGDTAAYYVGKAFGRHKLSPNISPGKTVEGALGGLVANLLVGVVFKTWWLPELPWGFCVGLVVMLGVMGQVGDLVESMLKRSVDSKDSGGILPGHGGVLDRVDGLLFAAPTLYYLKTYLL
jgi:phosphatidate cytidylyltransferase